MSVVWAIVGAVLQFFMISLASASSSSSHSTLGPHWSKFISRGFLMFYVLVLWPLVMKCAQKVKRAQK